MFEERPSGFRRTRNFLFLLFCFHQKWRFVCLFASQCSQIAFDCLRTIFCSARTVCPRFATVQVQSSQCASLIFQHSSSKSVPNLPMNNATQTGVRDYLASRQIDCCACWLLSQLCRRKQAKISGFLLRLIFCPSAKFWLFKDPLFVFVSLSLFLNLVRFMQRWNSVNWASVFCGLKALLSTLEVLCQVLWRTPQLKVGWNLECFNLYLSKLSQALFQPMHLTCRSAPHVREKTGEKNNAFQPAACASWRKRNFEVSIQVRTDWVDILSDWKVSITSIFHVNFVKLICETKFVFGRSAAPKVSKLTLLTIVLLQSVQNNFFSSSSLVIGRGEDIAHVTHWENFALWPPFFALFVDPIPKRHQLCKSTDCGCSQCLHVSLMIGKFSGESYGFAPDWLMGYRLDTTQFMASTGTAEYSWDPHQNVRTELTGRRTDRLP